MKKIFLLIMFLGSLYLLVSLFSYYPFDPSWFQATYPVFVHNKAGILGAFCADLLFFVFGAIAYFIPCCIFFFSGKYFLKVIV
nr:DNA translocase FtsK 4TM domain-containing protein [Blochmannia endosymbiont of Camponotus (Colobopsis) obliquus]